MLDAIFTGLGRGLTKRRRARWSAARRARDLRVATPPCVEPIERRRLLSAVNVLTYHNDNQRDGENLHETTLTPSNVNDNDFGKVATLSVDGQVYAQPLYVSHLMFPRGVMHNVVYVATENDSVYAFDANGGGLLWQDVLADPKKGVTTVPATDTGDLDDLVPQFGITGTPVIDTANNTLYVVTNTKQIISGAPRYEQRLYALNLVTGAETGSILIKASVPGTGVSTSGGMVSFNALRNLQRSALTLLNNTVYIEWSSHGDVGKYHGWMIGYNATTLLQTFVYCDSPDGYESGIWMSGDGLAVDPQGDIFFSTSNGDFNANTGGSDYGDSLLKFAPGATLPTDYFTPSDQQVLNDDDLDLGSGGVLILPNQPGTHTHELVFSGKQGTIYLVNRDNLGGYSTTSDQIVQELSGREGLANYEGKNDTFYGGSFDTPAYFNGAIYYLGAWFGAEEHVQAYTLSNGLLSAGPTSVSTQLYPYSGATPSISANGSADGIVWVVGDDSNGNADLHAYNAGNVSDQLYTSDDDASRDQAGTYNKFTPPTIANGRVYVAAQGEVDVYGLL
jgi:hypothetical protein